MNWLELKKYVEKRDGNPEMFEVYKRIGWHHALINNDTSGQNIDEKYEPDEKLFAKIKEIISKLVVVKPAHRMKLKLARDKLMTLDAKNVLPRVNDFLLLKKRFRIVIFFLFFEISN